MNIKFRSIIVDDEKSSRDLISFYLYRHKNIEIVATCGSVEEAIKAIDEHNPDLLFLDIEMPPHKGLDILKHYKAPRFKTIIITAYGDYAIGALKLAAYDFILKPLDRKELDTAIDRYRGLVEDEQQQISLNGMYDGKVLNKILIKSEGVLKVLHLEDVFFFKAEGAYTFVQCKDKRHVVSNNLKYFEDILPEDMFHRTHKSFIVNYMHVQEMKIARSGVITMTNGKLVQVSSRRLTLFKHWYFQKVQ